MILSFIQCPKCRTALQEDRLFNRPEPAPCPGCLEPLQIEVYPAFYRRSAESQSAETSLIDGESTCFYHSTKKAVTPCEGCGRFLCALCDCDLVGRHFCPICLEAGKTKGKIKNLENSRPLWDNIALALVVLPIVTIVFWIFSFFTAPAALFIALRYWNAPRSIFHGTKIRFVLAIVFSVLVIVAWVSGIYYFLRALGRG